jgi:hypothetical protein
MAAPTVPAAAPPPGDPVRGVVMRAIEKIAPRVVASAGIDKVRWRSLLERYMGIFHPRIDAGITKTARGAVYGGMIDEYTRRSRNTAIENLRDLEEIKAEFKRENRLVHVRLNDGAYVAKRERDCTTLELETLADQHDQYAAGHVRRAGYYRELARQMRLAGFDVAKDPLSRLLG